MSKLVDLSYEILDDMPVYPNDVKARLYQDKFLERDEYNNHTLEIGLHAGTHIDSPMHLTDSKTYIGEISLDSFTGRGSLLDVRGEKIIGYKEKYEDVVSGGDIVLLFTGHSEKYDSEEYYTEQPVLAEELVEFLITKKIKMIGMDLPSPEQFPFNIHKRFFQNGILIIENLRNLSELLCIKGFEVIAFPLKIRADSSISRVVARILD